MRFGVIPTFFFGLAAFGQVASLNQAPSIEQSLNFRAPSGAALSPDGKNLAYMVTEPNWEANAFESQIWVVPANGGEGFALTSGKKGSSEPAWSPDSKQIAFLSARDGKPQLYLISPKGGEARQLTNGDHGIAGYHWSPDGKSIAFAGTAPESKAKKERKEKLGEFEIVNNDYQMVHLWTLKIPTDAKSFAKVEALTEGDKYSVTGFHWSPDGTRIAFAATRDPDLSSSSTSEIYAVRLGDKFIRKLTDGKGPNSNPVWSPDGRQIAFSTVGGRMSYQNATIATVPSDGGTTAGGAIQVRSAKFDENPQLIEWGKEGIWFSAAQRTERGLFRLDPATSAILRAPIPGDLSAAGVSFSADEKTFAYLGSGPNKFPELYVGANKLTDFASQWAGMKLATRETVTWKSKDGAEIEGILIKPADYDAKKKYPLLVVIHGGPTATDTPALSADRYYPVEKFAAKGAIILKPNYRGSAGYGEKFRSLNVRNLGLGDYDDVISGVDALIAKGMVDADRVGSMGWSQGGYISAFITTYSTRFKAVSVGAGISDWMTYYVNTDIHPFTRSYLGKTPWEDPEIYKKTSPITYINNAGTPTLIQHGELDKRVPIANGYELYQGLKDRNVPVKMVVYKGFGHGITKPKEQRAVMEHNYEWFSKWIWGETPGEAASGK